MDILTASSFEKREGFRRERIFFSPRDLKDNLARHPMAVGLQAVHWGMFPAARHHSVHRPQGAPEAILIFCHSGRGIYEAGGVSESLDSGEVLFLPPGTAHAYAADLIRPWSIYWVHFSGTMVPPLFAQLRSGTYKVRPPDDALREIVGMFRKSLRILEQGQTLRSTLAVSHYLRAMIGCCFFLGHGGGSRQLKDSHDLSRVIRLMQDNPDRLFSLQEFARSMNLSPSRFSALFRARTGISPVQYHLRLRMQTACQLLDATSSSIKEIANHCGYPDPYYFSRLFKKITGLNPSEYRREQKG
ncbi:MAG: helix-turn-helix domain-containing protein [Terrimicrobiaceae bacterium]